jgi:hypothetical protein
MIKEIVIFFGDVPSLFVPEYQIDPQMNIPGKKLETFYLQVD